MDNFPSSLFLLPAKGGKERDRISDFMNQESQEISVFLPWLSGEVLISGGASALLNLIEDEGSKRIHFSKLKKYLHITDPLKKIIQQNSNYTDLIDVQSISGFIECLRKYCVFSLIRSQKTSVEIIRCTGVSIRTIQRVTARK